MLKDKYKDSINRQEKNLQSREGAKGEKKERERKKERKREKEKKKERKKERKKADAKRSVLTDLRLQCLELVTVADDRAVTSHTSNPTKSLCHLHHTTMTHNL